MPIKNGCKRCRYEMLRMYFRTRLIKNRILQRHTGRERRFETIGWYCENCKRFELDDKEIISEILS